VTAKKVFISHAVADKDLIDALVDLLQTGCNLTTHQIFASSIQGTGIGKGERFEQYMQRQLQDAALVIEVLTPSYWASAFCMCELGGQWALEIPAFPLLVPPLSFRDLKAVAAGREAAFVNNADDLSDLRDEIDKHLESKTNTARWNAKANSFLEKTLPPLLENLQKAPTVPISKWMESQEELDALRSLLAEKEEALKVADNRIQALKAAKSPEDISDALRPDDESEQFDLLVNEARSRLLALPASAREVLFAELGDWIPGEAPGWRPESYDEYPELERTVQSAILVEDAWQSGFYRSNRDNRKVKRAVKAFETLLDFEPSDGMREYLEEKYDIAWDSRSREWWEVLNLI
jgi:hypothetical protein